MIASTSAIVRTSSPRWPFNARSAASIAYATDETGSAITANANANNSAPVRTGLRVLTGGPPDEEKGAPDTFRRPGFPALPRCHRDGTTPRGGSQVEGW